MDRPESTDFLEQTIALWQSRCTGTLDKEDARQIVENAVGFFEILQEWDASRCDTSSRSAEGEVSKARSVGSSPTGRMCSGAVER